MKTLCAIFFFLLSFSMVYAQNMSAKKFWAGPTVGLNRTGMVGGKPIKHSGYETSYNLGGKFKYELG